MTTGFGNKYGNKGDSRAKFLAFKNIDMVQISPASAVLFTPFNGKLFVVTRVVTRTRTRTGTITTEPLAKLTDGTNDVVAAVAMTNTNAGRAKALTVISDRVVDHDHPLTLTKTVAAVGGAIKMDLFIEGYLV